MAESKSEQTVADYYRLKEKYDKKYLTAKSRIMKSGMGKKEIKRKIRMIKKTCINCGEEGGTVFENKGRVLSAKCGNSAAPCSLDIKINAGSFMLLPRILEMIHKGIEENKADIIDLKLDILFGLRREEEIGPDFEELKTEYKASKKHELVIIKALNKIDSILVEDPPSEPREMLISNYLKVEHGKLYSLVHQFKGLISEYLEETDTNTKKGLLTKATEMYLDSIYPLMVKIRETKYEVSMISREGPLFVLHQIKIIPRKLDFPLDPPEVISNIK